MAGAPTTDSLAPKRPTSRRVEKEALRAAYRQSVNRWNAGNKKSTGSAAGSRRQVPEMIRVLIIELSGKKRWEYRPNPAWRPDTRSDKVDTGSTS